MKKSTLLVLLASFGILSPAFATARARSQLALADAKAIAAKADVFATKGGFEVTIAIVDEGGNLVYLQRAPGAYIGSVEAAVAKARSANAFRRPTRAFEDSVATGRVALLSIQNIVALEGGVPIVVQGAHVGAIGVSGAKSAEDGQIAEAGLR